MNKYSIVNSSRVLLLLVVAATAVTALFLFGQALAAAGTDSQGGSTCFTTYGTFATTQFSSADATAVQLAVDAVAAGGVVKIAGFCAGTQTLFGVTQTVHINKDITLAGGYSATDWTAAPDPDTYTTTLDANGDGRVITISGTHTIVLSYLTIQAGLVPNTMNGAGIYNDDSQVTIGHSIIQNNQAGDGGGIYNNTGSLHLTDNVIVRDNRANTSGDEYNDGGGGLFNQSGHVTIFNSQILSNSSEFNGGGLMNKHTMTVSNSLIHGNSGGTLPTARDASLAAGLGTVSNVGGGVANFGGVLLIQNSTIRDNTNVAGGGGGIAHLPEGALTIVDSTIAGNVVNGPGGGILFQGTFTLTNSTVSGNVADTGAGIAEINYNATAVIQYSTIASNTASLAGDSIALSHADSIVALTSSIVASAGDSCDLPTGATIIDQGYNLESGSSCALTMTTSLANSNPLLLPLAANGGDTETHALAESSPALNTIPPGANGCGTLFVTDQRGDLRPSHGRCDMGSFEAQTNVYLPIILNQD